MEFQKYSVAVLGQIDQKSEGKSYLKNCLCVKLSSHISK